MTLKHASNITVRSLQFKFRNQSSNSKQRCSNANPCCNHDMSGDQLSPNLQPLPLSFSSGDPCPLTLARRRALYSNVAVMQTLAAIMTCQETSRPLTFNHYPFPSRQETMSPDFSPQAHSLQQTPLVHAVAFHAFGHHPNHISLPSLLTGCQKS